MILQISKISKIYFVFFLLFACSTNKQKEEKTFDVSSEVQRITEKKAEIQFGPTNIQLNNQFVDKTSAYGLHDLEAHSFNIVDLNGDQFSDLVILPRSPSGPRFFIFDPTDKKFYPSKNEHLDKAVQSSFLIINDFDSDKIDDLLAVFFNQKSELTPIPIRLFKGKWEAGVLTFKEEKDFPKIALPTAAVSTIDVDLDGDLDLFIGNWFEKSPHGFIPVADKLLLNDKGKFTEVNWLENENRQTSSERFPINARPTHSSSTCDIDQNSYPDILTASTSGYANKLWMNLANVDKRGERIFKDYGIASGYGADTNGITVPTGGGRTFFASCADYNNDDIMDIFVGELTHAYDPESVDRSSILTGANPKFPPSFLRTEYVSDITSTNWNQGDRRANWIDFNLDGLLDLLVDNSGFPPYSRLVLFEQDETHAFMNLASVHGIDLVNPQGSSIIDINQDGLPDILTAQNNVRRANIKNRIYLFENQLKKNGARTVRVYFDGKKMNKHGVGAMVWMFTQSTDKKLVQKRWVEYSQGGFASQNEEGIFFSIPKGMKVLGFKVRFPLKKPETYSKTEAYEWRYTVDDVDPRIDHFVFTLCEDGRGLTGKTKCY